MAQTISPQQPHQIYVGDLPLSATKEFLQEFFSEVGDVQDVALKVKEAKNGTSFAYAFITFANRENAERAVQDLNYTKLDNVPIRLSIVDAETKRIQRSGEGNLFIKNLDPTIEVSQLHEAFANFGDIISCKIPTDQGVSRGYGYVQFKRKEDAEQAMKDLCEASINGRPVKIEPYRRRQRTNPEETYTNVYVKDLPDSVADDEALKELFSKYGDVQSPKLCVSEEGKSRGFGFCNMTTHEDAKKAVEGLNGLELDGKVLTCNRAQSRDERVRELKEKSAQWRRQNHERYRGRNLYIRNFDEDMTEEELKKIFEQFGVVESIKIMREADGKSKKFGFVCYESVAQAEDCLSKSALLTVYDQQAGASKQLYVGRAESKEDRIRQHTLKARTTRAPQQQQYPAQPMAMPGMPIGIPAPMGIPGMPPMQAPMGMPGMGMQAPPVFSSMDAKSKLKNEILEQNPPNQQVLLQRIKDMSDLTAQQLISNQQLLNQWYNQE